MQNCLTSDLKCLLIHSRCNGLHAPCFSPFLQFGENEAPERRRSVYLHLLRMRTLSGDDALLVHQHLSERADFLANLLLRVPERGHKDTAVSGGTHLSASSNTSTFYFIPALCECGPYFFFPTKANVFIILRLIQCHRLADTRDMKPFTVS